MYGRFEMQRDAVIDHDATRTGRWLRARRLRLAAWIAVIEGVLVIAHVIPKFVAFAAAAVAILFYLWVGREQRSDSVRQVSWIAAASQALAVLIPVLLIVVTWAAITAVVILAVIALVALFTDRR